MKNKKLLFISLFFVVLIAIILYFSRFISTEYENISLSVYDGNSSGWEITTLEDGKETPINSEDVSGYGGTVILRRTVEPFFADYDRINVSSFSALSIFIEDDLVFSTIDEPIEEINELPLLQYDDDVPFDLTFTIHPSWVGKTLTLVTREYENTPIGSIGFSLINDYYSNLIHEAMTNAMTLPAGAFGLLSVLLFGLFLWSAIVYKTDFSILLLSLASMCLVFMQTSRLDERIFYDSPYGFIVSLLYLSTLLYIGLKLTATKKWFIGISVAIWSIYFVIYIALFYLYLPLPYWLDKISMLILIPLILLVVTCFLERRYNSFARILPKLLLNFVIGGAFLYVTAYFVGSEIYMSIKILFLEAGRLYFEPMLVWIFTLLIFICFILKIREILQKQIDKANIIADLKLVNALHEQSLLNAERTNSELAIMRHDEIHHLRMLTTYLNEDIIKAKDYIHSLSDDLEKIASLRFSTNTLINSILSAISYNAKQQNVTFTALANVKDILNLQDRDIALVLMNLCDNAINASQGSKKKIVDIKLSQDSEMLYIKICNSIPNNFDKNIFHEILTSPKQDYNTLHGHGIISVRSILAEYGGELHYEVEKDCVVLNTVMQFRNRTVKK